MVEETGEGAGKGGYPMTGGNMCWGTPSEGVNSHGSHQEGGGRGEGREGEQSFTSWMKEGGKVLTQGWVMYVSCIQI